MEEPARELEASVLDIDVRALHRDQPDVARVPSDMDPSGHPGESDLALLLGWERGIGLPDRAHLAVRCPVDVIGKALEPAALGGIARVRAEREDPHVVARHDVVGPAAKPDLDERRILPGIGLRSLDARVKRDHAATWHRILQASPGRLRERAGRQVVMEMAHPRSVAQHLLAADGRRHPH
jgi:hypothetical protein